MRRRRRKRGCMGDLTDEEKGKKEEEEKADKELEEEMRSNE